MEWAAYSGIEPAVLVGQEVEPDPSAGASEVRRQRRERLRSHRAHSQLRRLRDSVAALLLLLVRRALQTRSYCEDGNFAPENDLFCAAAHIFCFCCRLETDLRSPHKRIFIPTDIQSFKNDLIEMSDHSLTLTDHGVRKVLGTGTYMYNWHFTLKGFRHTV